MNREIIARGQNASMVLNTPEFKSTMEAIRLDVFNTFAKTHVDDIAQRESLHKVMLGLNMFKGKLEAWIAEGEFEIQSHSENLG